MRRILVPASTVLALTLLAPAQAANVHSVSSAEFGKLLVGCWLEDAQHTYGGVRTFEESGACFHSDGKVDVRRSAGSTVAPGEGLEDTTWYKLAGNKLVLGGVAGWIQAQTLVCDAVIVPSRQLRLRNCVDDDIDADGKRQTTPEADHDFKAMPDQMGLQL